MPRNPNNLTHDAITTAINANLTLYETELVRKFYDEAAIMRFVGPNNVEDKKEPGAEKINWKILRTPGKVDVTRNGNEGNSNSDYSNFETVENYFVVADKDIEIKWYDMEKAMRSNFNIETESARAVGALIAEEMDYQLLEGNTPLQLSGIKDFATTSQKVTTAGAWSTTANIYTDIIALEGKIRQDGWGGPINMLATPGVARYLSKFVTDGTDSFSVSFRKWLDEILQGGTIIYSSHPFTQHTGPRSTDKKTGSGSAADNQILMAQPDVIQVKLAHDLISRPKPAMNLDVWKNESIKFTCKVTDPARISYMESIDMVA